MKVTVLLKKDHDTVKSLFAKYKNVGSRAHDGGKREVFEEIRREVIVHSQIEREIFYPALQNTPSIQAEELVAAALEEHRVIEELLQDLSLLNAQDKQFDSKMTLMIEHVNRHFDREEEQIFGEARKSLPEYRLEELGLEVEIRKRILGQLAA